MNKDINNLNGDIKYNKTYSENLLQFVECQKCCVINTPLLTIHRKEIGSDIFWYEHNNDCKYYDGWKICIAKNKEQLLRKLENREYDEKRQLCRDIEDLHNEVID